METSGFGSETDVSEQTEQPVQSSEPQVEETLGNSFLTKIPEQDRAIVAKYVKEWDANVTRKFQESAGKLKPYESLGPLDEVQKYVNFGQNFRNNPQARDELFRRMWQGYQQQYGEEFDSRILELLQLQLEEEMNEQEFDGGQDYDEPDEFQVFQQNVSSELEELRAFKESYEGERQTAQEMEQLDTVIKAMHNKFGDFNDRFILAQLATGADIPTAIKAWNETVSGISNQQGPKRQPPKTIGTGQGGVPNEQVNTNELRGKDRRAAVEAMLEQLG